MNTITTKDGGEVNRYIRRRGTKRVAEFMLVCAVAPLAETVTQRKRK